MMTMVVLVLSLSVLRLLLLSLLLLLLLFPTSYLVWCGLNRLFSCVSHRKIRQTRDVVVNDLNEQLAPLCQPNELGPPRLAGSCHFPFGRSQKEDRTRSGPQ